LGLIIKTLACRRGTLRKRGKHLHQKEKKKGEESGREVHSKLAG